MLNSRSVRYVFLTLLILLFIVGCELLFATYIIDTEIVGEGSVQIDPLEEKYREGTLVTLTAVPASGWKFSHWAEDIEGFDSTTELLVDGDKKVTAVFERREYTISISVVGEGKVDKKIVKTFEMADYPYETIIELQAIADPGWEFWEWQGDIEGNEDVIQIKMDNNKDLTAVFREKNKITGQINITHNWPTSVVDEVLYPENVETIDTHNIEKLEFEEKGEEYVPGQLIVGFLPFIIQEEQVDVLENMGATVLDSISSVNAYLIEVPENEMNMKIGEFSQHSAVAYVEHNYYAQAYSTTIPNDSLYNFQWHYPQIRLPQAWNVTTGASWVRVAVLDTGIDVNHPDLGGIVDVESGYNFVDENSNSNDGHSHGTHVAGTIGADTDNNQGVAGIMWEGSIIPVKVLSDGGGGTYWSIAQGILYSAGLLAEPVLDEPAHVINMSLGGPESSNLMADAVQDAANAGSILVAASGNNNGPVSYPARYPEVIAVGSVDYNYPNTPQRAPYSNYGPQLDVVAPGGDSRRDSNQSGYIDGVVSTAFSTEKEYGYHFFQGTSMAAPHVAGVIGLMLANGIPQNEIQEVLHRTSMELGIGGYNYFYGYGLVNAYWAVNNVKNIRLLVGSKQGNIIEAVAQGEIDVKDRSYILENVPSGEYQVFAWIDVQGTGKIDPGDYLAQSKTIHFTDGQIYNVNLNLVEMD